LFSGALTEYNGIKNLIEAFHLIENVDVFLDIYGDGYLKEYVNQASQNDKRIRYHGRVDNKKVLRYQREAWLLINPRNTEDIVSKVTFPSKTFEYLLSGTPVLSTRLNGYTEEYNGTMFFIDNNSPEEIAKAITSLINNKADMQIVASRGREFVKNTRSWKRQAGRIYDFICKG